MAVIIRNFREGDQAAILAVSAAADAVDRLDRRITAEDLAGWLTIPGVCPERDYFLAEVEGQLVGFVGFDVQTGAVENHVAYGYGEVRPDFRRQGVGTALMEAVEARAVEVFDTKPPGLGRVFEVFCRTTDSGARALVESRGMREARRFLLMSRDLTGDLPEAQPPAGIEIRAFREEDNDALRAAYNAAFQDHWGYEPVSVEDWGHFLRDVPHFRPELWVLAWDGNEIVGFNLSFVEPGYMERVRRKEGRVAEVAVRRPWRRRGVAAALLAATFRALREAGMESAALGVDADSQTGAVRLYERTGFTTRWEDVVYRKAL